MLAPDEYDGADTRLCADCDEVVDGYQFHPDCCPHDEVEEDDGRDGVGGRLRWFCESCGDELRAEPNEDGGIDWVLAR
jgi:hypothetical protein